MPSLTAALASLGPAALLLLAAVVFAETGLLVGFFLPGDSLLFAAGLLISTHVVPVPVAAAIAVTALAAIAGDQVGFTIGGRLGPALFRHRPTRLWSPHHVESARVFFDHHGHEAVILARFVPLARTFTPVVAGAVGMPRRRFSAYNIVGGLGWTTVMILAGYFLGGVTWVAQHVELVSLGLVALSLLPAVRTLVQARRGRDTAPASNTDHVETPRTPAP